MVGRIAWMDGAFPPATAKTELDEIAWRTQALGARCFFQESVPNRCADGSVYVLTALAEELSQLFAFRKRRASVCADA
jgi:hypothetical protein